MSDEMLSRLEKLEKEVDQIKKRLQTLIIYHEKKLGDKFDTHDRARNLLSEFEAMRIEDTPLNAAQISELKTIIKCFVELVDFALGVKFP